MNLTQLQMLLTDQLEQSSPYIQCGRVQKAAGLLLEASGMRQSVGDRCLLELADGPVPAEVVGFSGRRSFLMPLAPLGVWAGVWLTSRVSAALFYRLAYTGMFLTGVKLLYDGLR